jgi:GcrA cell cycle regulator
MTHLPAATTTDYGLRPEPRQPSPKWTEAEFARLKELTAQRLSASQIAAQMPGRSRNSIIGKQHRTSMRSQNPSGGSLPGTRTPGETKTRRYKRAPWAVDGLFANGKVRGGLVTELPPEIVANAVTFAALQDHHCRWPVGGEGHNTLFCGGPMVSGLSYCPHHCRIAYAVPPRLTRAELELHQRKLAKSHRAAA